jgi:NADH:ubiquinone oxidoreductase subunit E
VVCIAACDKTPCAQINLEYHENLTDEQIDKVIADLRKQG